MEGNRKISEEFNIESYYSDISEEKIDEDKTGEMILDNFYSEALETYPRNDELVFDIKDLCKKEINNYIKVTSKTIIKISDNTCTGIITSNCKTLEINRTMRKTLFSKKSMFYVIFSENETSGYLKIVYKGFTSILPFFTNNFRKNAEIGVDCSFDIKEWYLNDIFLPEKRIDIFYHEIRDINFSFDSVSKILIDSLSVGVKVIFRYNILYSNKEMLLYSDKMEKYIEVFTNFTELVKDHSQIVFEPLLFFEYFERSPKKIFCNVPGKNIVSFSRTINEICLKNNVEITYSIDFNKIIADIDLIEGSNPTDILYKIEEIIYQVKTFMEFFINPIQKNICVDFMFPEKDTYDAHRCLLFFCRSLINKINTTGTDMKCTLFLTGGHMNDSQIVSKYTNSFFENCKYEWLSSDFIFGNDNMDNNDNIFLQKNNHGVFDDLLSRYNIDKVLFNLSSEDRNYTIQRINE